MSDPIVIKIIMDPGTEKVGVQCSTKNVYTVVGVLEKAKMLVLSMPNTAEKKSGLVGVDGAAAAAIAAAAKRGVQ
jgi:hypothetical protein